MYSRAGPPQLPAAGVQRVIAEANLHNPHRDIGKSAGFPQDLSIAAGIIPRIDRKGVDMLFSHLRKTAGRNWRHKVGRGLAALPLALGWPACDSRPLVSPSPVPTQTLTAPALTLPSGAQPLTVGEKHNATLDPNDRSCQDDGDGERYPCLRFIVTAPTDGSLSAQVTWDNPAAHLLLLIYQGGRFVNDIRRVSPLHVTISAGAGGTYLVEVWNLGRYGPERGPEPFDSEQFELTTELEK